MPGVAPLVCPLIAYLKSAESLSSILYAQGYSGHGVNVTHLTGQIIADAIGGTLERFDLFAKIKPIVIPRAHTFSKPMVALGMLYYQLKDRLQKDAILANI
tara:strand:- start:420 stop:722 length:303 start_codon:yes stop_codon:yes gene_type:complete